MVKTRRIVLEEKIAYEMQRLKLKYFGDHSLEMSIPAPIPPTYQGLSEEKAVEPEEDFDYKWRFHVVILTGEDRLGPLHLYQVFNGGGYMRGGDDSGGGGLERIFGSFGYDAKLSVRECELEALDVRSRELEYAHYFYEVCFRELIRDTVERERYKVLDMESGNDASVLELRMVRVRSNKCQPLEREGINSDQRLKRAKDYGSRSWLNNIVVRERLDATADSHSDTEECGLSLPLTNLAKGIMNAIGESPVQLNENMWEALPASGTTGSGEVAKDKRRRVEPSGESGEKVVEGRFAMVEDLKEVEERARLAVLHGEEDTSRMVARLVKGIWLVRQLKASHAMAIGQLQVETKANLDEMVEERDRLGRYLMLKGYSEEKVDVIKANTYVEEEDEEETEAVGIVGGLDGISRQTVLDNQGDDVKLPEGGSEKAVREMTLRISRVWTCQGKKDL
ncbi:hypothetical protein GIB67_035521 [Kingdonia uniflora]|uniref:Uncharacterized protein n=1 Tax=Kingdonia uniflora TaxID=39325 RepID=A0A7J7MC33_9MAGN|nr:hypothetical protein GIB67_035521 [Kingdonia uniflora]